MDRYNERFAEMEMSVTEWQGATVRVSIQFPGEKSATTQMVISTAELKDLNYLQRPEDIELALDSGPGVGIAAAGQWDSQRKRAERVIEMISNQIANQISRFLIKEIRIPKP